MIFGKKHIDILRSAMLILMVAAVAVSASGRPKDKIMNRPYADQKRIHLGFSVGLHVQDLDFTHNGFIAEDGTQWSMEVPSFSPGFCVNVLADLRLHRYLNLRFSPGMYFGSKTVQFLDSKMGEEARQDIKSAYVALPLDLKISGDRLHNSRPYVTLGALATYDVSKKRSEYLRFNSFDTYLTVGIGCDFYLPFFKLNPEIKFCFGLSDILQHNRPDLVDDPATMRITQSLQKVKSKMVMITFYFE